MSTLSKQDGLRYARQAFREFWSVAHSEFPENMSMSFEEFWGYMNQRQEETLADFGKAYFRVGEGWGASPDDARAAMEAYARKSRGMVSQYDDGFPRMSDFYDALIGKMNEWPVTRIGSAFGNTLLTTGEQVTKVAALAAGSYLGIMAVVAGVGALAFLMSLRKK